MSIAAIIFTLNKAQWDSSGSGEQRRDVKSFHLPSPLAIFFLIRCLSDKVGQHYTSAQPAGVEEG